MVSERVLSGAVLELLAYAFAEQKIIEYTFISKNINKAGTLTEYLLYLLQKDI